MLTARRLRHGRRQQHPRLLLICPSEGIETNPTLMLLLEMLADRRVEVDVLYKEDPGFLPPGSVGESVRFLPQHSFAVGRPGLMTASRGVVRFLLGGGDCAAGRAFHPLFGLLSAGRYAVLMGVDPSGIFIAHYLNRYARRPLIYLSFELLFSEEISAPGDLELRRREAIACRHVSLALVQDEERARLLCQEVALPRDRVMLVPVAPPDQEILQADYLRATLGISAARRIVLYCGNVADWASRDEWAEMLSYWPDRYCLVVHSRSQLDRRTERHLQPLVDSGKLVISSTPVPRWDMVRIVASADFGLASYKPVPGHWVSGLNLYHLGLSSGKVSYYAMCGKPILARSLPVFEQEFARYDCGRIYRRLAETGSLLTEMDRDYRHHSAESRRFYRERLDPSERMARFCDRLIGLANGIAGGDTTHGNDHAARQRA